MHKKILMSLCLIRGPLVVNLPVLTLFPLPVRLCHPPDLALWETFEDFCRSVCHVFISIKLAAESQSLFSVLLSISRVHRCITWHADKPSLQMQNYPDHDTSHRKQRCMLRLGISSINAANINSRKLACFHLGGNPTTSTPLYFNKCTPYWIYFDMRQIRSH